MRVEEIIPKSCSSSYGHPSGHTFQAIAYLLVIWFDYWKNKPAHKYHSYKIAKFTSLIFILAFSIFMGISRVYVGVHAFNHVLYGWLLGVWMAIFLHFCLRDRIINHIDILLRYKNRDNLRNSGYDT